MDNTIGVALVYRACPVCGQKDNGEILTNSILTEGRAEEINKLHNKCIGYSDEPCKGCKEMMEKAFLCIIYDESKTTEETGPYRTGQIIGIKKDCNFVRSIDPELTKRGFGFVDIDFAKKIGLIEEES